MNKSLCARGRGEGGAEVVGELSVDIYLHATPIVRRRHEMPRAVVHLVDGVDPHASFLHRRGYRGSRSYS